MTTSNLSSRTSVNTSNSGGRTIGGKPGSSLTYPQLRADSVDNGHILALYTKSCGEFVLVGDVLRSVTLLQYRDEKLVEIARDFNTNEMRAIEILGQSNDVFLGADDCGNFFSVKRNVDASSEEERGRLDSQGVFNLGDYVNVFRKGNLNAQFSDTSESEDLKETVTSSSSSTTSSSSSAASVFSSRDNLEKSSVLFGTISGAIGTVISLSERRYRFFAAMERAMKSITSGVGGLSHEDYRSFYNTRRITPQKNFVDGDLVERFLDLGKREMNAVVSHVNDEMLLLESMLEKSSSSTSTSTSAMTASGVAGRSSRHELTVEECVRRVEDMSRMH